MSRKMGRAVRFKLANPLATNAQIAELCGGISREAVRRRLLRARPKLADPSGLHKPRGRAKRVKVISLSLVTI